VDSGQLNIPHITLKYTKQESPAVTDNPCDASVIYLKTVRLLCVG